MKLFVSQIALAAAQIPEIYFDAHIQNAEQLKTELFTDEGRFMIDTIRNGILGGGVTKDITDTLEMVCDKCSNYEPKLSDVQNMLLFPDLTEDGGLSQQKLDVFMSNICLATNCRDKVATCPQMIQLGNSCNSNYMAENCRNSCGCVSQECPPIITDDIVMEVMVEHDAEHSDEIIDLSISDAIKLLDPTSILGQFQPDVRTTLQSQMCTVPNIDNRIVSANDLLRQLVDADTAKLMNHINEKLPMYLSFLPESTKELLANDVICHGYQRSVSEAACLSTRLSDDLLTCDARLERWTFDKNTGECVKASYDGCYDTENRFASKAACLNKCQSHIKAAHEINKRKLENFIDTLNPTNLRDGLLGMFGKHPDSKDTVSALLKEACDPVTGKVAPAYRERLCERLFEIDQKRKAESGASTRIEGANPVEVVEEICPESSAERKFCTARPGRGQWQKTCQEAGCCWDPSPPGPRSRLLWKDYCFQKIEKRTIVTVPLKQIDETDEEHSSANKCNVAMANRTKCAARQGSTMKEIRQNCLNAGCCFETNNGRMFPFWRQTCFNGN